MQVVPQHVKVIEEAFASTDTVLIQKRIFAILL